MDDLRQLPLLEKETVRAEGFRLIPAGFHRKQIVWFHTSGTTGKALEVPISRECFEREYAFRWLHYSWAGIQLSDRIATIAGHPVAETRRLRPPFWMTNYAEKQLLLSSQHLTPATIPHYAAKLRAWGPALIHGYPSSIYLLALGLAERQETGIRPRAIFTASETLLETQRSVIESVFGCKVYNWYGNTEMTANIVECDYGRLHVKPEHSFLEFLDPEGRPARPGELAEIIATGFGNDAFPLIRYRTGDTAILSDRPCECGRSGPRALSVTGRVEDIIVTPEGRHVGRLDHVFKDSSNVREAQLIQETPDTLVVRIVRREDYGPAETERVTQHLRERLGDRMRFEFQFVDHIPRGANGKFRFVISKVGLGIGPRETAALP
jgi:phenylacetate-CoA ligase